MNWSDLSMSQRSELMSIYLKNGITSLDEMKKHYNSFAEGGNTDIPPERFFGIATPEVTDNNIYYSRNSLLPEVNVTAKGDPRKVNNDYYKAHSRTRANIQDSHARAGLQYLSTIGQGLSALSYFTGLGETALPIKMGFRGLAEALGKETARNAPQYIMQLPDVTTDVSNPDAVSILLDSPGRIISKVDDAIPLGKLSFLKYLDNWIPPVGAAYDAYGALTPEEDKEFSKGGTIYIKPENRGKFTALKERTGHSASWFKEHGTPAQKKMAVFELNSRKWKK